MKYEYDREYSVIKLFLFARNIFLIGILVGIIMLYYGKTHLIIHSNREIVSNYTVFNGIIKSYTITETEPYHLDMYAFNNGTNVFCVYRDFYVGKMSDVEYTIHQNVDTSIKWHQKINTHECIGDLNIYYKILFNNYYGMGLLLVLLFITLQILITFVLGQKIYTYNSGTHEYLSKNMIVIIALNVVRIMGFMTLFYNLMKIVNHKEKLVVCEIDYNSTGTNDIMLNNSDGCTKYYLDNYDLVSYGIGIVMSVGVIGIIWFVLFQHQRAVLAKCVEKISNTQSSTPNEETPLNTMYTHPSYV